MLWVSGYIPHGRQKTNEDQLSDFLSLKKHAFCGFVPIPKSCILGLSKMLPYLKMSTKQLWRREVNKPYSFLKMQDSTVGFVRPYSLYYWKYSDCKICHRYRIFNKHKKSQRLRIMSHKDKAGITINIHFLPLKHWDQFKT